MFSRITDEQLYNVLFVPIFKKETDAKLQILTRQILFILSEFLLLSSSLLLY